MPRSQPIYQKLVELLEERIRSGEWKEGGRLPSEPQLAAELGVAYMTLRKSISALVDSGRLTRIRGRGTFITAKTEPDRRPGLGLLLIHEWHSLDPFYFPSLVAGFARRAEQLGYQVHLADRSEPLVEYLELQRHQVRAVACVVLEHSDLEDADALLDQGVLVVAINQYGGSRRIPSVSPDNRGGAMKAARSLIDLGHKHFAFLAGPKWNLDAMERRRGVVSALKEAGLEKNLTILEGGFLEDSGYQRGKELASKGDVPTGVLAVSDLAAIGLMKALQEEGIAIPDDVSVFGFGDFRLSGYVYPALTTVRLPLEEIGQEAAQALTALCRGIRLDPIRLDCPIIWRESVGPAPRLQLG